METDVILKIDYSVYKQKQKPKYQIKNAVHQGRNHLIVPVIMMVEGVHNGSAGPVFHSIAELGKFPESWNGIPVVIDHPKTEDGTPISANSPEVIDSTTVGRVYNTHVVNTKLVAEAWIDEEKIRQVSPIVLAELLKGELLEVSLGMFNEKEEVTGEWHGESYDTIAINHRPDHLALLPGGTGACSVRDGCGIRTNNKKGGSNLNTMDELFDSIKGLNKEGYVVNMLGANSEEQGYKALVDAVRQKLDAMDSDNSIHFLQEVYEDYIIYEVRLRVGGSRLFKQNYQFEADGTIALQGNPEEVRKKVEYVTMAEGSGSKRTRMLNNNKKEIEIMADEKCTPCIKKKVDALIANAKSGYTEDDRVVLETLSEAMLDKISNPVTVEKVVEKVVEKEVQVNMLSDDEKAALAYGQAQLKANREKLISGILANTEKGIWSEEILKAKDLDDLNRISAMSTRSKKDEPADYSFNGGEPLEVNADSVPKLLPAGVEEKITK
jgi:hypothetical protein